MPKRKSEWHSVSVGLQSTMTGEMGHLPTKQSCMNHPRSLKTSISMAWIWQFDQLQQLVTAQSGASAVDLPDGLDAQKQVWLYCLGNAWFQTAFFLGLNVEGHSNY
jgi:hypothetical protein